MRRQVRQLGLTLLLAACAKGVTAEAGAPDAGVPYALGVTKQGDALQIAVTTRDGFHLNADYPVSFKTDEGARAELKDAMKKTACETGSESCSATMQVPNKSGTLAFSVCSPDLCRIEKVPLKAL